MSEERFHLVFRGEVLEGQHPAVVGKRLAALLKIDEARARALFSGKPVVLKRDLPKAMAAKYQAAFRKAGARLRAMPAVADFGKAESPPPPARPPQPQARPEGRKPSLAERLAQETAAAEAAASGAPTAGDPSEAPGHPAAIGIPDDVPGANAFSLAPEGEDLVSDAERARPPVVEVDVSHLSAAPAESGSLEDLIDRTPPPPPPDTSALSLDEVGVDLSEAVEVAELRIDLSALSLAEPGADLGVADSAPPPVAAPDPDFSLAEPGADLDETPRPPPPPAPDTSHLKLVTEPAKFGAAEE